MFKILTLVCVLALIALAKSVATAVVQRSDVASESRQINSLSHDELDNRHELSALHAELQQLRNKKKTALARDLGSSVSRTSGIRPDSPVRTARTAALNPGPLQPVSGPSGRP
jgi:hypothetical protein